MFHKLSSLSKKIACLLLSTAALANFSAPSFAGNTRALTLQSQRYLAQSDFPKVLLAPEQQGIIAGNNNFALKLFGTLIDSNPSKNVVISPVCIVGALEMILNAANGETYKLLASTLGVLNHTLHTVNEIHSAQLKALLDTDLKVKLIIANAMFANREIYFKQTYLNTCKQYYNAKLKVTDFSRPDTIADMNDWISKTTDGKIVTICDQLDMHDIFVLMNATYFKGPWLTAFNTDKTMMADFHKQDGAIDKVPLMQRSGSFNHLSTQDFEAVSIPYAIRLPYDPNRLTMYVFLPNQNSNLTSFLKNLNSTQLDTWFHQFTPATGSVSLPKMDATSEFDLSDSLKKLGLTRIFDRNFPNFGEMCFINVPNCLGQTKHKVLLVIDEEGSPVKKGQSSESTTGGFNLVVDRPFFFAVRDNRTQTLLFVGAIYDPHGV
jgi:serpin B